MEGGGGNRTRDLGTRYFRAAPVFFTMRGGDKPRRRPAAELAWSDEHSMRRSRGLVALGAARAAAARLRSLAPR